jgi:hypothetical protein
MGQINLNTAVSPLAELTSFGPDRVRQQTC